MLWLAVGAHGTCSFVEEKDAEYESPFLSDTAEVAHPFVAHDVGMDCGTQRARVRLDRHVARSFDHRPCHTRACEPPDQTWLEGIYDRADFDDIVDLLTSSLEATGSPAAPEAGACRALVLKLCPARVAGPASVPASSAPLRAPPSSDPSDPLCLVITFSWSPSDA